MTEPETELDTEKLPEVLIEERSGFSIVWLIPLVAALVGGWLAYKALSEKGPTVTITFKDAEGLEAGKTKVRYKHVEVGQVVDIKISEDLSHVLIKVDFDKDAEPHLRETTRFWVVRARVAAGQVSGLGTLFSGAYIGMDPGTEGKKSRHFTGLERPPLVTTTELGRHFVLRAKQLNSIDIGAPVYFRQIKVGEVEGYDLDSDGQAVSIKIFVHDPFDQFVRQNTRFWNAGGIDVSLSAEGLKVNTMSLVSIMLGGVAFDMPPDSNPERIAEEDQIFELFANREAAYRKVFTEKEYFLMYFTDSARGLTIGAPVELAGIKVGEVREVTLEYDEEQLEFRVRTLIVIEPGRANLIGETQESDEKKLTKLVEKGLRAQLDVGNLLTGQLLVKLDFYPDAPSAEAIRDGKYLVVPTIPMTLETIATSVTHVLQKLEQIPIEQIAIDLQESMRSVNALVNSTELQGSLRSMHHTLKQTQVLVKNLNAQTAPAVEKVLDKADKTLASAHDLLRQGSTVRLELEQGLKELSNAARSIRIMADYLERHPEALIQGKGGRR